MSNEAPDINPTGYPTLCCSMLVRSTENIRLGHNVGCCVGLMSGMTVSMRGPNISRVKACGNHNVGCRVRNVKWVLGHWPKICQKVYPTPDINYGDPRE
jgi:hypothetical protein